MGLCYNLLLSPQESHPGRRSRNKTRPSHLRVTCPVSIRRLASLFHSPALALSFHTSLRCEWFYKVAHHIRNNNREARRVTIMLSSWFTARIVKAKEPSSQVRSSHRQPGSEKMKSHSHKDIKCCCYYKLEIILLVYSQFCCWKLGQ